MSSEGPHVDLLCSVQDQIISEIVALRGELEDLLDCYSFEAFIKKIVLVFKIFQLITEQQELEKELAWWY